MPAHPLVSFLEEPENCVKIKMTTNYNKEEISMQMTFRWYGEKIAYRLVT